MEPEDWYTNRMEKYYETDAEYQWEQRLLEVEEERDRLRELLKDNLITLCKHTGDKAEVALTERDRLKAENKLLKEQLFGDYDRLEDE